MKKQPKKLMLAKETVLALDDVRVKEVAGGVPPTALCTRTCTGSHNTCGTFLC